MRFKDNDNINTGYDKIKHLVAVDDDIFAFFIVESSQVNDLYIANTRRLIHLL